MAWFIYDEKCIKRWKQTPRLIWFYCNFITTGRAQAFGRPYRQIRTLKAKMYEKFKVERMLVWNICFLCPSCRKVYVDSDGFHFHCHRPMYMSVTYCLKGTTDKQPERGETRLRTKSKFSFAHSLHLRTKKYYICAQIIVDICAQFSNKQLAYYCITSFVKYKSNILYQLSPAHHQEVEVGIF